MTSAAMDTRYRRSLPEDLVAFSSPQGRALFRDALAHGTMEGWFALAEQFHTQAEPAFCGLGSLVVALNALGVDPKRPWKGAWRWYSEELLDCCVPLPEVREHGVTLEELGCLARCNGLTAEVKHARDHGAAELGADLLAAGRGDGSVVIASYGRAALGQTGDGHFSPVGGVDAEERRALLLDVARFKYPPHWVSIERLYAAMSTLDSATSQPRGWVVLRRRARGNGSLASLFCAHAGWRDVIAAFDQLPSRWRAALPADVPAGLASVAESLPALLPFVDWRAPSDVDHAAAVASMRRQLRESRAGLALAAHTDDVELGALLLLIAAPRWLGSLERQADAADEGAAAAAGRRAWRHELADLADLDALPAELAAELELVRQQLSSLAGAACAEGGCAPTA
jgi:glutathione gamma-glutamylcysteinyltransferase